MTLTPTAFGGETVEFTKTSLMQFNQTRFLERIVGFRRYVYPSLKKMRNMET